MELREIEIFLVLAEELHFGRTAERLHVSQARVSQVIKKQERRIGAPLFERSSRAVALTPLGRRLREDLRVAFDLVQGALARARADGQGLRGTLRVGFMGALGNEMRYLIDEFRERHPDCEVESVEFGFGDPFGRLRAGEIDVQLIWLPVREPDLSVGPVVLTEGRALAVPSSSDLALRAFATLEDLAGRQVLDLGDAVPDYWVEAMLPRTTPGGRLIPRGPFVRTSLELLTLVADGQIVSPVGEHVSWYFPYCGVVYVPFRDAPRTEWALVWTAADHGAHVHAFVRLARELGIRRIVHPDADRRPAEES
ncbi:LysR family transcriptional regulator [Yinghuangia soli]|uniref:LysR substrate-binding domain-containing protein n=1 Tax=Yinghuangia soli TaxID=2908204 RepID=A0AA41U4R7_9ACTN|nr:LysR substrate-binding domain-containing protein [Yinghuangia soli]MCF2529289.1 LysR substrate-binding domain-containing protein [Yinghuangia soli]